MINEHILRHSSSQSDSLSVNPITAFWNTEDDEFKDFPLPEPNDPDLKDPHCDPQNPVHLRFHDVSTAAVLLQNRVIKTPCFKSNMSKSLGMNIYFKKEFTQHTGSFKERGACNTMLNLNESQRKLGVIAASAGNHALALAYHGHCLNIPVMVVMPTMAPIMKINNCFQYKARVLVKGNDLAEAKRYALKIGKMKGMMYINGYDHPHVLAGQGTAGLEILEQVPEVDAIVMPVGGGSLIAGVGVAVKNLKPQVEIIGVESSRCAGFAASLLVNHPVPIAAKSSIADGLAVSLVGVNSVHTSYPLVDRMVQVDEEFIALAILRLIEIEKSVVEGAGATGLAALLAKKLPHLKGKNVVVALTGGNIDTTALGRCIERGLAADGRLVRFQVVVSDNPGGIAELTNLLWTLGVSVKDIFHERAWLKSDIFQVMVKCICETRDKGHAKMLESNLRSHYQKVFWGADSNMP